MNLKHRQTCRICGNPNLTSVIDLGMIHSQGAFLKKGQENLFGRKIPNLIVRCDTSKSETACGLVQTKHSVPTDVLYSNYWYQSGISQTMKTHLSNIVSEALAITRKGKGIVIDIASNDNTLLRNYSKKFKKIGIDPSDIASRQKGEDITVINEIFPTNKLDHILDGKKADIVTSIACYYDVEDPVLFAKEIKSVLKEEGVWIFEVAYLPLMIKNLAYDSIVCEHIVHYHLAPLEIMFKRLGLRIFKAVETTTNGGSVMCFVTHENNLAYDNADSKSKIFKLRLKEFEMALDEDSTYIEFGKEIAAHKEKLLTLLMEIKRENKTVHVYGASTKLNTILGYCGIGPELIEYAAERSPEKAGCSTLDGVKIISEKDSRDMKPDYYLVGPYHFKNEITEREKEFLKNGGKLIFPLPAIEIRSYD